MAAAHQRVLGGMGESKALSAAHTEATDLSVNKQRRAARKVGGREGADWRKETLSRATTTFQTQENEAQPRESAGQAGIQGPLRCPCQLGALEHVPPGPSFSSRTAQ